MDNLFNPSSFRSSISSSISSKESFSFETTILSNNLISIFAGLSLMELKSYKTQLAINAKKEQNTLATNEVVIEKNKDIKSNSVSLTTIKE